MEIHRDLRIRKVYIATILLSEFSCTSLNYNISKVVTYINDIKYWKGCYVLMKLLFPCIRFNSLYDSNIVIIDKVYYYSIIKKYIFRSLVLLLKTRIIFHYQIHLPIYGIYQNMVILREIVLIQITQIQVIVNIHKVWVL